MSNINTTRLATGLGKLFGGANEINTYRGTTVAGRVTTVYTQLTTATDNVLTGLYDAKASAFSSEAGWMSYLQGLVSALIVAEVKLSRPLASESIQTAVAEWRRQMLVAADTFNDCPSTITPAAIGSPVAVGYQFVTSTYDGTGVAQDLIVPDVYLIQTTGDKDHGGTKWAETLDLTGKPADANVTDQTYPSGTGLATAVTVADPAASSGLTNDSSFDSWTTNTPNQWTLFSGTAGVNIFKGSDDPRDGSSGFCLELVGDGTTIVKVRQSLDVSANELYAVHFRLKKVLDPGTDWAVSLILTDISGTAVTGDATYSNVKTSATAASVAADWTNVYTATFVTPTTIPTGGLFLEIRLHQFGSLTTAAVNTSAVYVDHVDVRAHSLLYTGGPHLTVYSGTTASVNADAWTLTVALTAGTMSTFIIRWIDRMIDLKGMGIRLPTVSGGTETQADALIS